MRAFAIFGAILCAWISGVGAAGNSQGEHLGALAFLFVAVLFGLWAWHS